MIDLPNKYKFSILYDDKEHELQHDPKGWEENSIGFTRSSDFGNNVEYVVPLKYAFDGRQLLKMLWERDGIYAKAKLRIYKKDNEYTFNHFYQYLFDFTTYQDDLNYVTMNGIEDSFYSKFQTFANTEYGVPLPQLSNKLFLNFTGTSVVRENRLQFSYGEPIKGWLPPNNFPLRGTRAVRSFVRELAFTDSEGLPYDSLTIRAVENVTFELKVNMDIQTKEWIITLLGYPDPRLRVWKHQANGDLIENVRTYQPETSKLSFWSSVLAGLTPYREVKNTFVYEETLNISLNAGELLSFCYVTNFANSSIRVLEALNSDLRIDFLSASNYQDLQLEVFPFSYLLRALVEEIDSEAILEYDDRVEPYLNMLTCTDAIINAFGVSENKIHCSLRKALDALNVLECIYIDFTGNKMRVGLRKDSYLDQQIGEEIEVSNIVIKQQTDHIFSRIVVGWESDERVNGEQENTEENGLTYPFCEKKTFEIKKALKENEYSIVSPFMGDCYTIEAYFRQVLNDIENKKDKKIISLACIYELADVTQNLPTFELGLKTRHTGVYYILEEFEVFKQGQSVGFIFSGNAYLETLPADSGSFYFYLGLRKKGQSNIEIKLEVLNITTADTTVEFEVGEITEVGGVATFNYEYFNNLDKAIYEVVILSTWRIDDLRWSAEVSGMFTIQQNDKLFLYRKHEKPIADFLGDSNTVYNVPYTPKRIINNHLPYLSISLDKTQQNATFVNSLTGVNISSRCDFEDEIFTLTIVEQIDSRTIKVQEDVSLLRVGYRVYVWKLQQIYDANIQIAYIDIVNKIIRFNYPVSTLPGTGSKIKIKQWIVEAEGFSAINPIFLPSTIELSTAERLESLTQLQEDRYGFFKFRHEKTGKIYQGWINTITFAVGKNETQNWELQAKNI